MKRLIAIILVLVTVLSLTACGGSETPDNMKPSEDDVPGVTTEVVDSTDNAENTETSPDNVEPEKTEPVETEPVKTEPMVNLPEYKMAQIGYDSRVAESEKDFHKTGLFNLVGAGQTFYALSWVFEETEYIKGNYDYYTFKLKDAATGEIIENDRESVWLYTYQSKVYDIEGSEGDTVTSFSNNPSKYMYALVLYSNYEIKFEDIEIWTEYNGVDFKLDFNADLTEIASAPARADGYMFIKLKDSYYVADSATISSGGGDDCKYNIYDFISIKDPLTNIGSNDLILDASKITFYDMETGEYLECVPDTKLYYQEKPNKDAVDVCIGVETQDEEIRKSWSKRYCVFYDGITLLPR